MYNSVNNIKYIKSRIPKDRLEQYNNKICIDLINEIERTIFLLLAEKKEQYGVSIIEGDAEALYDLRIWLCQKKIEINTNNQSDTIK